MIKLNPKIVEKIEVNAKKAGIRQIRLKQVVEPYPEITFDYQNLSMNLSGEPMNLNPPEEDVKADIKHLLSIFEKYNSFVGTDPEKQQDIYYKLLNAMFASPFFARLRCEAELLENAASSFPLYLLIHRVMPVRGKPFL